MAVWRIRMRNGSADDRTAEAWTRREVGIWYGGWSADDFERASGEPEPWDFLSRCDNHRKLFPWDVTRGYYQTTLRLASIPADDWVLVVAGQTLHLGRLETPLSSDPSHPLNHQGELFKVRRVGHQKRFPLAQLPEVYSLVPQAGRGNVFQFGDLAHLVSWLAEAETAPEVSQRLAELPLKEFIGALGPRGWESIAEAYLILEEQYVPVGLAVGGTLKTFDLMGRSLRDGARVVAQCKNTRAPSLVEPDFLESLRDSVGNVRAYYFAYGGCFEEPPGAKVVTGEDVVRWLEATELGQQYLSAIR